MDRAGTIGTVLLGITVRCAQCHDHKYDPIKQRDFYQIWRTSTAPMKPKSTRRCPAKWVRICARARVRTKRAQICWRNIRFRSCRRQWEQDMLQAMDDPGKILDWDFQVTEIRAGFDHADTVILHTPRSTHARRISAA